MSATRPVFFVSDHTGITAEVVGKSLLSRFSAHAFTITSLPFIDDMAKAERAAQAIDTATRKNGVRALVISTLTDGHLRQRLAQADCLLLDVFSLFLAQLETELGESATPALGQAHGLRDNGLYRARIEAVNYALAADDGLAVERYDQADLILVGVSRCGKTPTSLYMAMQYGLKVANDPLTPEDLERNELPRRFDHHLAKLRGLTLLPERLAQIREERRPGSGYASLANCRQELHIAERLMRARAIPLVDSTQRSVEEIAALLKQSLEAAT